MGAAELRTPRWKRVRAQIRERDGYRCRQCGKAGRLEVDHIVPIAAGGDPWEPANLQTLCIFHHHAKGREDRPPVPAPVAAWRALVDSRRGP